MNETPADVTPPATTWGAAIRDKLRAVSLLIVALIAFAIVYHWVPEKTGPMAYLICRLAIGAFVGYWVDRILFPRSRPHTLKGIERGAAEKRRSLIVAACVVAAGFNL